MPLTIDLLVIVNIINHQCVMVIYVLMLISLCHVSSWCINMWICLSSAGHSSMEKMDEATKETSFWLQRMKQQRWWWCGEGLCTPRRGCALSLRRPFCWHSSGVKRWLSSLDAERRCERLGYPRQSQRIPSAKWIWISRLGAHIECHKRSPRSPSVEELGSLTMWSFHQTKFCTLEEL